MAVWLPLFLEKSARDCLLKSDMGFKHSCLIVRKRKILASSTNIKLDSCSLHAERVAIDSLKGKGREEGRQMHSLCISAQQILFLWRE